ncbi:MAG: L-2-amino-thiazoline-4-carboxylic acid hydrolase [Methanobacterium sp.]|uniref:L-2-amino-thiazoline-4-carboxylic acid hydrolase n=1 Tax=Methanobacterium sp. TaxID=2164 RepID=UPI003D6572FC|nr:L-2-amino-thiazoline-4-carboxylic acid hydrolase [Methanobacterium sp.]
MSEDKQNDYYNSKKSEFFTQFHGFCECIGVLIEEKYGKKFKEEIIGEIRQEYEAIYEKIPYIGGDENSLTFTLVSGAQNLAFYKVLKRHDKPLKEIGELAYKAQEKIFKDHPELIPPMTDPDIIPYIKYAAEVSREKKFSGDWVYEFIDGNEEFDFGTDFTECAIKKLYHKYDADEFTPYLCAMDILMSDIGNLGLHRRETLAEGSNKCDFRYKGGRETKIFNTVIKG